VYVDSSALVKLVIREAGSPALGGRLAGEGMVSSALSIVEVGRAARRADRAEPRDVRSVISLVTMIDVDATILRAAASLDPPFLRSLDAIHLATALTVAGDIDAFITYDRQLSRAASAAGFVVERPA